MKPFTAEYGTFWAIKPDAGLPPVYSAEIEAEFVEANTADIDNLAIAMNLPSPALIEERFKGQRRCFCFKKDGRIISYGWVTHGPEQVGEFERHFNLHPNEAYIWHCGTVPEWRQKGLYTALLNKVIYRLAEEQTAPTIWIGASRLNQPSIQGIAKAGFKRVLDATYRRTLFLTFVWFKESTANQPALIPDAYRIMQKPSERRIGNVAIGWYTG
jgi:RimJ/RimL family protein N-acetyltransferase